MKRRIAVWLIVLLVITMMVGAIPLKAQASTSQSQMTSITTSKERIVIVTVDDEENKIINKVPLFNQNDYPTIPYSAGSIATSGCGITCMAMVGSYLLDENILPADLAKYTRTATNNVDRMLNASNGLGLPTPTYTHTWEKVRAALENGQVVISLQGPGLFTDGGHFIVLTGLTKDGKITVNDPNGYNWKKDNELIIGFEQGFEDWQVKDSGGSYWIYDKKQTN